MRVGTSGAQLPPRLEQEPGLACAGCRQARVLCDRGKPCGRCVQLGRSDSCRPTPARKRGRPPKRARTAPDGLHGPPVQLALRPMVVKPAQQMLQPDESSVAMTTMKATTTTEAGQLPRRSSPVPGEALMPLAPRVACTNDAHASSTPQASQSAAAAAAATHASGRGDGDATMATTLLRVLIDEVRDIKEENERLRRQAAKSRARRKESEARMRAMEQSMRTMAQAQRESAMQITSLMSLFQQEPTRCDAAPIDAFQSPTPTPTSTTTTGLSYSVITSPISGGFPSALVEDGALHGRAALMQAFPFLRGYDPTQLTIYDPRHQRDRQPFMVMRIADFESVADMTPPVVEHISPSATALFRYTQEELVSKLISVMCTLDINTKLDIIQPLLGPVPQARLSEPVRACLVVRPKGCEPILLETFHQILWVDTRAKWDLVLLGRVLKEGVTLPPPMSIADLLANPRFKAMVDARPVGAARSVNSAQLRWPNVTPPIHELVSAYVGSDGVACLPAPSEPVEYRQQTSSSPSMEDILQSLCQSEASPQPPDQGGSPALSECEWWLL